MFYKRIRNLREDSDYTQESLAKYLNVSQPTYSDYERGEISVPIDNLIRLAKFYDTSIDYIVELTDDKAPYHRSNELD